MVSSVTPPRKMADTKNTGGNYRADSRFAPSQRKHLSLAGQPELARVASVAGSKFELEV